MVHCPIELDGTAHLCSCPPQSFSRCIVHGISCRWLPEDPADRPSPRGAGVVPFKSSVTLATPRPGIGTGSAHHLWLLDACTTQFLSAA